MYRLIRSRKLSKIKYTIFRFIRNYTQVEITIRSSRSSFMDRITNEHRLRERTVKASSIPCYYWCLKIDFTGNYVPLYSPSESWCLAEPKAWRCVPPVNVFAVVSRRLPVSELLSSFGTRVYRKFHRVLITCFNRECEPLSFRGLRKRLEASFRGRTMVNSRE